MISEDPLDRLADVPIEEYHEALSMLFISFGRIPKLPVAFVGEKAVIIQVINENPEAIRTLKAATNRFDRYIDEKLAKNSIGGTPSVANTTASNSLRHIPFRSESFAQQFMMMEPSLKEGLTSIMLNTALSKFEQQGRLMLSQKAIELLASPDLQIIEPWEQASVCHKCPNFEQIVGTNPNREAKCSKCGRDCLTVRIYTLDKDYEIHKRRNKDLPLFIAKLINRQVRQAAIASKDLRDFGQEGLEGDIDVYIEKTHTGIESKLRSTEARPTDEQLRSYAKEIETDLKKYLRAGMKHLVVITNLCKEDAEKLNRILLNSVEGSCESLGVVHDSIHELNKVIDEQIERLRKS